MITITIPIPSNRFHWIFASISMGLFLSMMIYYGDPTDQRSLVIDFPDHYFLISILMIGPLLYGGTFFIIKIIDFLSENVRIKFRECKL